MVRGCMVALSAAGNRVTCDACRNLLINVCAVLGPDVVPVYHLGQAQVTATGNFEQSV